MVSLSLIIAAQYLLQEASEQIVNLGYDDIREGNQDTNLGKVFSSFFFL